MGGVRWWVESDGGGRVGLVGTVGETCSIQWSSDSAERSTLMLCVCMRVCVCVCVCTS